MIKLETSKGTSFHVELDRGILTCDLDREFNPSNFHSWPLETKIECLNGILILYNLRFIPESVYLQKYQKLVEEYVEYLEELKEM